MVNSSKTSSLVVLHDIRFSGDWIFKCYILFPPKYIVMIWFCLKTQNPMFLNDWLVIKHTPEGYNLPSLCLKIIISLGLMSRSFTSSPSPLCPAMTQSNPVRHHSESIPQLQFSTNISQSTQLHISLSRAKTPTLLV